MTGHLRSISMAVLALILIPVSLRAQRDSISPATPDSAFAALQARGLLAMGVDQYTSSHVFEALPDGGRIELQRDVPDSAGIAQIRDHLRSIAVSFRAGDFGTPATVHDQPVPGTKVMALKRDTIRYEYSPLPKGGEVRITSRDPEAVRAIHEFLAFQNSDHRTGPEHQHQ